MNAPLEQEVFSTNEKENVGIAVFCRGFLMMVGVKRAVLE